MVGGGIRALPAAPIDTESPLSERKLLCKPSLSATVTLVWLGCLSRTCRTRTPPRTTSLWRVHAAGFTRGELAWEGTWTDRGGRDRTPSVPGHEVSGVVAELGYGTTGLTVGQRVFGLADWARNGTLAEYVAMEARNLAPPPVGVDHAVAAGAVISGLTAWQGPV
jgi:NADPH:quinone reductase-like Zn-dependent oxidoreductase